MSVKLFVAEKLTLMRKKVQILSGLIKLAVNENALKCQSQENIDFMWFAENCKESGNCIVAHSVIVA